MYGWDCAAPEVAKPATVEEITPEWISATVLKVLKSSDMEVSLVLLSGNISH